MAENSKTKVEIMSVDPYITTLPDHICGCALCRNNLNEPCNTCRVKQENTKCDVVMGKCGHKFHKHCIEMWTQHHSSCPYPGCSQIWEPV